MSKSLRICARPKFSYHCCIWSMEFLAQDIQKVSIHFMIKKILFLRSFLPVNLPYQRPIISCRTFYGGIGTWSRSQVCVGLLNAYLIKSSLYALRFRWRTILVMWLVFCIISAVANLLSVICAGVWLDHLR